MSGQGEQGQGQQDHPEHREVERVKSAREILEEKLSKMKSEAPQAGEALKAAAEKAPSGTGTGTDPLVRERDEWKNEALRARADLDNYQKRIRREMEELRTYAAAGVLSDVIAAIDNLDLALQAARAAKGSQADGPSRGESTPPTAPPLETHVKGVEMVRDQLEKILADRGAERIPAEGVPFDPRKHEAVLVEERSDVPDNTAVQELRRGYALKDRPLRTSQVKVSRKPAT